MTMKRLFVIAVCTGLAAGCAKRPAQLPSAAASARPVSTPAVMAAAARDAEITRERGLSEEDIFSGKSLDQLNAERPLSDVFFQYDSIGLQAEARTALERNAAWLNRWTSTRIVVEGHADERGTAEYNLALGDQRAREVRNYLISLGVPEERMITAGKGKEQPFCTVPAESCWSQNRRGHFVLVAK